MRSVERIGGGGNSRVYAVRDAQGRRYAAKWYHARTGPRDRMAVEFDSMRRLWTAGVRCIPEPLALSRRHRCAFYEYIEGRPVDARRAAASEWADVIRFVARLKEVAGAARVREFAPASEACFSGRAAGRIVARRLARLLRDARAGEWHAAMRMFLLDEVQPMLKRVEAWGRERYGRAGSAFDREMARARRTLSPSDFGFHNALRRGSTLVFIDFEYFGWDDPAKMIADFVLHPAMTLPHWRRAWFERRVTALFPDDRSLALRLEVLYPLTALKWCLLMLNEFVPGEWARRRFAREAMPPRDAVLARQLAKARRMLARAGRMAGVEKGARMRPME